MAFRSTAFDPVNKQVFKENDPSIDFNTMEQQLAQEMARMKITDERKRREIEKICADSDELKELQAKIKAAYLNKERNAQITEGQYRKQQDLVSASHLLVVIPLFVSILLVLTRFLLFFQEQDAAIDIEYLHRKEKADSDARQAAFEKQQQLFTLKKDIQQQMIHREQLREDALAEYQKERANVDAIINKMIEEDHEMIRINKMKQEQSKQDMILSVNEKKALLQRQKELEEYEEELVRQYAAQ